MTTHELGPVETFPLEQATAVKVEGQTYVVVRRQGDELCVFSDRCPHVGLSLTKGPGGTKYSDGVITCPFHNSEFDVCSGANLDWAPGFAGIKAPSWSRRLLAMGRKPASLRTFPASVVDGQVVVEQAATS
jgi:nitrite reductase/ring-hydroxylating ferredoxin subunit